MRGKERSQSRWQDRHVKRPAKTCEDLKSGGASNIAHQVKRRATQNTSNRRACLKDRLHLERVEECREARVVGADALPRLWSARICFFLFIYADNLLHLKDTA